MMRLLLIATLLCLSVNAQAGDVWERLWQNSDQRAEALMQQGNAGAAAHTFSDPRRKAYAELKAGAYAQAAQDYAAFDDGDSHYNRGNALARAGRLQEALAAYDAALARDPDNRDARRNRDLVAKALQQQPPQSAPKNDDKNGKGGDKNNNGDKNSAGDKAGKQAGGKQGAGQNQSGRNGDTPQQQNGVSGRSAGDNAKDAQQPGGASGQDRQQAGAATAQGRPDDGGTGSLPSQNDVAQQRMPVSEQQISQEQWLRRIPDDPGGLLRRKFMIEHMIRQQGGQP